VTAPLLTTAEAAARLGVDPSRVRQLATRHGIGTKIDGRTRVFTAGEVDKLAALRRRGTETTMETTAPPRFHLTFSPYHRATWMRDVDPDGAVCELRDRFGARLALGEVALRDGEPVVLVDDDAHTVLTTQELHDGGYRVAIVMPTPHGAPAEDYVEHVATIARRAAAIAGYGVFEGYA
jgi:hypothetical protein